MVQYSFYNGLRWFRRLIGIGLVANLLFVVPALFAPRYLERLIDVGTTNTVHWLQNVGVLLLIVTFLYLPVIQDPFRYSFISYLVVAGRFAAGMLFLLGLLTMNYPRGMWALALSDLILSPLQAIAWYYALRDGDPRSGFQHGRVRTA